MELAFLDMTLQLLMKSPDCTCIHFTFLYVIHKDFMKNTVRLLGEILTHCVQHFLDLPDQQTHVIINSTSVSNDRISI